MQHRSDWLRERDPELYKGHLQFFGKQGQPVETIDTYDGCPDAETFAREYAYRHKPVLMRGCARTLPAFKWTDETMRAKADPDWHPTQELQANSSPGPNPSPNANPNPNPNPNRTVY